MRGLAGRFVVLADRRHVTASSASFGTGWTDVPHASALSSPWLLSLKLFGCAFGLQQMPVIGFPQFWMCIRG